MSLQSYVHRYISKLVFFLKKGNIKNTVFKDAIFLFIYPPMNIREVSEFEVQDFLVSVFNFLSILFRV